MLTKSEVTAYVQIPAHPDTLVEKHETEILKCFTISAAPCRSIRIYDRLSDVIAELVSKKKCFLIQLEKYLFDKAFYSLEEYLNTLYRLMM
jgi:hypothetical protein